MTKGRSSAGATRVRQKSKPGTSAKAKAGSRRGAASKAKPMLAKSAAAGSTVAASTDIRRAYFKSLLGDYLQPTGKVPPATKK